MRRARARACAARPRDLISNTFEARAKRDQAKSLRLVVERPCLMTKKMESTVDIHVFCRSRLQKCTKAVYEVFSKKNTAIFPALRAPRPKTCDVYAGFATLRHVFSRSKFVKAL